MTNSPLEQLRALYPGLIAGAGLTQLAPGLRRVDDPLHGQAEGGAALENVAHAAHGWLVERNATWAEVSQTTTADRIVLEGLLGLTIASGRIDLPVALVADLEGQRVIWLRIYHSTWPLTNSHRVRPPLLSEIPGLHAPDVVGRYQDALGRGDLEQILALFAPDGCAREPSGGPFLFCGPEGLRRFYGSLFDQGGGIPLQHCSITDDGVQCALEYNAVRWGRFELPPQAGVAVYRRGAQGKLQAARIYDDVDPPG